MAAKQELAVHLFIGNGKKIAFRGELDQKDITRIIEYIAELMVTNATQAE